MINRLTGQFLKGHVPANKGKTWDEYMSKRAQKRAANGWKNVEIYRPKKRPDTSGRQRKRTVVVTDDGRFKIFADIKEAAKWLGGGRENIGRCCRQNMSKKVCKHDWRQGQPKGASRVNTDHKYKGYRFYFFDDQCWWDKVENSY